MKNHKQRKQIDSYWLILADKDVETDKQIQTQIYTDLKIAE